MLRKPDLIVDSKGQDRVVDAVRLLKETGVAVLPEIGTDLAAALREFDGLRGDFATSKAREGPVGLSETKTGTVLKLGDSSHLCETRPILHGVFASKLVRDISVQYLGSQASIARQVTLTEDVRAAEAILPFHFDDIRSLKFLLYLTDTREEGGAFECIPRTAAQAAFVRKLEWHRLRDISSIRTPWAVFDEYSDEYFYTMFGCFKAVALARTVTLDFDAGALIIFDTDVLHRAGTLRADRTRKVVRVSSYESFYPDLLAVEA